jgi:hypothetical protein
MLTSSPWIENLLGQSSDRYGFALGSSTTYDSTPNGNLELRTPRLVITSSGLNLLTTMHRVNYLVREGGGLESLPKDGLADVLETTPTRLRWILNELQGEELAEESQPWTPRSPRRILSNHGRGSTLAGGLEGIRS